MIAKLFEKGIPSSGGMMPQGGATTNSMGSSHNFTQDNGPQRDPKFR